MEVLNTLSDWNKLTTISQTTVRSWGYGLSGMSEKQIRRGLELTKDHVGFFDVGVFRKYCFTQEASHKLYTPPPATAKLADLSSFGKGERWNELAKVTKAMMEEGKNGPITRATLNNKLTRNVIRGKSADEIIAYATKLYGQ